MSRNIGFRISLVIALIALSVVTGCAQNKLLDMAFLSLTVQVVDENDKAVPNAIVETTDGQKATADSQGIAKLKFGAIGVHQISVMAQDRVPAQFSVTMPLDQGKTKTARVGKPVSVGSVNVNASTNINVGMNMSGAMMAQIYPMLFQAMFSAYGYSMDMADYNEGQWTEWKLHNEGDSEPMVLRKAYLKQLDNKQTWWQMLMTGKKPDDNMTMEVLFSANRDSIRRMRQQLGKQEAGEVPVSENWYSQPTKLTPESLEGAVKQRAVTVKVPAGTFKADLIEFGAMATGGKVRMWRVKEVPGGVVRTEATDEKGKVMWWSELNAQGSGAKTALGSY